MIDATNPDPRNQGRHWLARTRNHTVLLVLFADALVLLSDRFRWFGFGDSKVRTAVFAFGAIPAGLLLASIEMTVRPWLRGHRFQFSLRTLFIVVTLIAAICAVSPWIFTQIGPDIVEDSLVGMTETTILARYGTPKSDVPRYENFARELPPPLPPGPIRTLVYIHSRGGTLWVWLCQRGGVWTCFRSIWYSDRVQIG